METKHNRAVRRTMLVVVTHGPLTASEIQAHPDCRCTMPEVIAALAELLECGDVRICEMGHYEAHPRFFRHLLSDS